MATTVNLYGFAVSLISRLLAVSGCTAETTGGSVVGTPFGPALVIL